MSKSTMTLLIATFAVLVVGAVAYGLWGVFQPPKTAETPGSVVLGEATMQSGDGGGVQVQVTYAPAKKTANVLVFQVAMNTHSVELGGFDLAKLSRVTLSPGGTMTEVEWKPEGGGQGHHVSGTLTVKDPKGLISGAKTVKLELLDVAGIPVRPFEWQAVK